MCAVFETNVFGIIAVTQVMLPRLREAPAGRIVNVSSSVGSLTLNQDSKNPHRSTFGAYSSSKTALNAVTLTFALDLEATRVKVNAACPGFTATEFTNFQGTRTVQQAAREASASRYSMRMVRRVRSRTRTARSRGDVVALRTSESTLRLLQNNGETQVNPLGWETRSASKCCERLQANVGYTQNNFLFRTHWCNP